MRAKTISTERYLLAITCPTRNFRWMRSLFANAVAEGMNLADARSRDVKRNDDRLRTKESL
jgi:hypothetical protein